MMSHDKQVQQTVTLEESKLQKWQCPNLVATSRRQRSHVKQIRTLPQSEASKSTTEKATQERLLFRPLLIGEQERLAVTLNNGSPRFRAESWLFSQSPERGLYLLPLRLPVGEANLVLVQDLRRDFLGEVGIAQL